jgi:hypothetical protein
MINRCKKQSKILIVAGASLGLMACAPIATPMPLESIESNQDALESSEPVTDTSGIESIESDADTEILSPEGGSSGEAVINPLTGQVVQNGDRLKRRPIIIKVTLYPRNNRPQWGLSQADIIYEHYTEGGLSRFSALYYGQEAEIVGPIRSARFVDIQLVRMYGAIFAYGSADYRVLEQIDSSEFADRAVREFPAGCPPLCRLDPTGQNHLVTDTNALQAFYVGRGIDLSTPNLEGMVFETLPPANGEAGKQITITYSEDNFHEWLYIPENSTYRRSQENGEESGRVIPLTDRTTGDPIETANVVLLMVPHDLYAQTPEIIDIQLYGEGKGLALRDGAAYEVQWIRPYPQGVLYLVFPDGTTYPFKPGSTWFELVGTSSQIEQSEDLIWRVTFDTP